MESTFPIIAIPSSISGRVINNTLHQKTPR
jgi:hypothetical protein